MLEFKNCVKTLVYKFLEKLANIFFTVFINTMKVNNPKIQNKNNNNHRPAFGAKLGWRAVYELKNTPEKLEKITNRLKDAGEPTTIVDIMTFKTTKGNRYSLRLFNEIFGDGYNLSLLKDTNNKEIVLSSAKDFVAKLENLTKTTVENKEYLLFNKIKAEHSSSLSMTKYLKGIIERAKKRGQYLKPKTEQTFFDKFK